MSHHEEPQLFHLSLEALFPVECAGIWLVIDWEKSLVTKFQVGRVTRIRCHQSFPPNALRTFIPLLLFPECPYSYLLAALEVSEQLLLNLLTLSWSDPLVLPFFEEEERKKRLLHSTSGSGRELYLRPLRRIMSDTVEGCNHMGLTPVSLRRVGYRLQPTIVPENCRRVTSFAPTTAPLA